MRGGGNPLPLAEPNAAPFTGIFQEGCGDPSRALVHIQVADAHRRPYATFDFHVQAAVPFRGSQTGLSSSQGGAGWGGLVGPFRADPANAAGGTVTVTARIQYADGSTASASASTEFKPCRR
jgi:hypothetical protein